jgi:hypothetical protein
VHGSRSLFPRLPSSDGFRWRVALHMTRIRPRSKFGSTRQRIAAPPLLIRGWVMLSIWMQTTGAYLLAVNRCSPARVRMPAQDSRSAHGFRTPDME